MPQRIREKLKINSSDLLPLNEKLIYGSLTGYGEKGPDSHRTAFDTMAWWARSGLMDIVRPSRILLLQILPLEWVINPLA